MVKKKPTVALFGGSFDPPHKGHQAIVSKVASFNNIDKLIVMPAFISPFKKSTTASAQKRLQWCKQVFSGKRVLVSDFEIMQNRAVYTIETLLELRKKYRVRYLVIGSDNLEHIEKWHDFGKINNMLTWLVFTRDGAQTDCSMLKRYEIIQLNVPISSTNIRSGNNLSQVDKSILNEVKQINTKDKNDN